MTPLATLSRIYQLPLPADLFHFWECQRDLSRRGLALATSPLRIRLGMAFQAFEPNFAPAHFDPLLDDRYRLDPPEFVTLLHGFTDGLHWGYYVDDPAQTPYPVAAYYHSDAYELHIAGNSLLEAVRGYLEIAYRDALENLEADPAYRESYEQQLDQLDAMRRVIMGYATADRPETDLEYIETYRYTRHPTAPTRDGMGIVVPPDTYRRLNGNPSDDDFFPPTAGEVQRLLDAAMHALHEGFAGTALQLGKDLWPYPDYVMTAADLLDAAYAALGREWLRHSLSKAVQMRSQG